MAFFIKGKVKQTCFNTYLCQPPPDIFSRYLAHRKPLYGFYKPPAMLIRYPKKAPTYAGSTLPRSDYSQATTARQPPSSVTAASQHSLTAASTMLWTSFFIHNIRMTRDLPGEPPVREEKGMHQKKQNVLLFQFSMGTHYPLDDGACAAPLWRKMWTRPKSKTCL